MEALSGKELKNFILGGFKNLEAQKAEVDALNVFPVPDGDTGTNMFLTFQSAINEINKIPETDLNIANVAEALSKGSLMGARGNSGVILSQIFRGMAQKLVAAENNQVKSKELATAFQAGVKTAYNAVMKPVEGTILTVSKEVAAGAVSGAKETDNILSTLATAIHTGEVALKKTPEQLHVLKQAGVVDAGGKGFLVILEGGMRGLQGEEFDFAPVHQTDAVERISKAVSGPIEYRYCTEFLVTGGSLPLESIKNELTNLGDSLLVVGDQDMCKVHVHTNRPDQALELCIKYGELHEIKIDNMADQSIEAEQPEPLQDELKEIGIVSVATGDGLIEILDSMGVDNIVTGGQTMNPSTENLLEAVEEVNAKKVIILPNNSNIILAAEQTKALSENKEVGIVPTKSIPEAVAALIAYNPEASLDENIETMTEGAKTVKTGEITYAVRDSKYDDLEIKEGEILGLVSGKIVIQSSDINEAVLKTVQNMDAHEHEIITLFYGEEVNFEQADQLRQQLVKEYPEVEVEMHYGGQSLYYYLISVE
ncbi:hypothetical protein GGQ84_001783 [Desulfitispora alkaliphila]|uniref:DAK2 domain-containing protein n=1 Tax=Desulfitispora alkaliphila TaxID=622674 RepID=UPI003D1A10D1